MARVYVALYLQEVQELISTGETINEKTEWGADGRPKKMLSRSASRVLEVESQVWDAITRLKARKAVVTPLAVKREYLSHSKNAITTQLDIDRAEKKAKVLVKTLAAKWKEDHLFRYRESTRKAVRESIDGFLSFLKATDHALIERDDLGPDLIASYERYLQDKKKLSDSTHGKRMKHLRWFLKHIDYDVSKIKIRTHRKEIISLSLTELEKLENVLPETPEENRAKDIFLLGCYLGLRISDLKRITPASISQGRITMVLRKNNRPVQIPITGQAKTILDSYANYAPKINEQSVNKCLKLLCQRAGITDMVTLRKSKGGRQYDEAVPKFKLITTHIAGKTFISTVAPKLYNMTPADVAAITGKDLKTLLGHYYQLPQEEAIKKMST